LYRRRKTVLVIDDEADVREVVSQALTGAGFKVRAAPGGAEALKLMEENVPDLVILDLKMVGMDGPTLLKEIRRGWGNIAVLVLTGYPESELTNRALQYPPTTLLSKPFTPEQVVETARSILGVQGRTSKVR
jgi:CheY-like chemotaxis protein